MPYTRRSVKRHIESSDENSNKTPLKKKITPFMVDITPLSENVIRKMESDESISAVRRLDNLQTGNDNDKKNEKLETDSSDFVGSSEKKQETRKTPLKKKIAPCVVDMTPLNENVDRKMESDKTVISAPRRLDDLQTENDDDKESEELEVLSDTSDLADSSDEDQETRIKKFTKQREQIKQKKQDILRKLAIVESTKDIHNAILKEKEVKKAKQKIAKWKLKLKTESAPSPRRTSLRLMRKDPSGFDLPPEPEVIEENPRRPGTEFSMEAVGFEETSYKTEEMNEAEFGEMKQSFADYKSFMKSLTNIRDIPDFIDDEPPTSPGLQKYQKKLQSMNIKPEHWRKVTKSRIFSLAFHPSLTDVLIAAGDKKGYLGLWRPLRQDCNDSTYMFKPHSSPISCLRFSTLNAKLYMCSYDGQLRSMDLGRNMFDEAIINDPDFQMSGFDFLESNHTLIMSRSDGCLSIVDTRVASRENAVCTFEAHHRATKCVSCHPLQKHYVTTSHRDGSVFIFDVRRVRTGKKHCRPVVELKGHSRSVSSAYFSPATGRHVLTTSYDDHLRIFDTSVITSDQVKLKSCCYHNNQTGRWLSSFRAAWHPTMDDVFVVGSMNRPRQIDVYDDSAKPLHVFSNPDVLTYVCSINCFHDNRNILAGGNSSGKVVMFSEGL